MTAARKARPVELTARELVVVSQVAELRLMSGRQIEAVHFPAEESVSGESAARHCRRVLAGLVRRDVLVRLDRRIGGVRAGSHSYVYGLGHVGHELLEREGARPRRYEPSEAFVLHQLAVSQLVVDLLLATREGRGELLRVEGEPRCWRSVPAFGRVILRPDLLLEIGVGEFEYRWFVELDRGTHHRPAVVRKARLYESYYRSGVEQSNGAVFPRVIWIVPNARRQKLLEDTIKSAGVTEGLMLVVTADETVEALVGGRS